MEKKIYQFSNYIKFHFEKSKPTVSFRFNENFFMRRTYYRKNADYFITSDYSRCEILFCLNNRIIMIHLKLITRLLVLRQSPECFNCLLRSNVAAKT